MFNGLLCTIILIFFVFEIFVYFFKIKEYYNPQFQFSKSLKPHGAGDPF